MSFRSITEVKDFLDPDNCRGCEDGNHISATMFADYAEPEDIVRWLSDDYGAGVDVRTVSFGNEDTEKFAAHLRTLDADTLGDTSVDWESLAESVIGK